MTPTPSPISRGWNRRSNYIPYALFALFIVAPCIIGVASLSATGNEAAQLRREAEAVERWTLGIKGAGYVPPSGVIPDEKTAIKVADAIAVAAYGEKQIASERPLGAALIGGDVWLVWGTLRPNFLGGTVVVKLSKRSGKVLFLAHGQ